MATTARKFLVEQLGYLSERGWDVHLACAPEPGISEFAAKEGTTFHAIGIVRQPNPAHDIIALARLLALIHRLRPRTVVMGTPKMGLLGLCAAAICRVPRRVYVLHGLRLEGASGTSRWGLATLERIACASATRVIAVSPSLKNRAIELGVASEHKMVVLLNGSANGVDTAVFHPPVAETCRTARTRLGIQADAEVVLFLGRITRDKGLHDLLDCWCKVQSTRPNARLLVVGDKEPVDVRDLQAIETLEADPTVSVLSYQEDTRSVLAACDLLVMPSHREGLGMVAIEAALCGVPTAAYAVTGTEDAITPGLTGLLVPPGNTTALACAISQLLENRPSDEDKARMHDHVAQRYDREALYAQLERVL